MNLEIADMNLTTFIIYALGAFRITHLIISDVITAPLRWMFLEEIEEPDALGRMNKLTIPKLPQWRAFLGMLFACPWCMSFWVSVLMVAGWYWIPQLTFGIALIFALSAVAGTLETVIRYWQVHTYSPTQQQLQKFEDLKQQFFESKPNKSA
ncbi:DUF1360 domain-containing protein [Paenibacillus sp. SI8]|uniref:DUF1360 domain-containing protein n=1 Tax=unclassified Paenibacillus TaxID=185978 RepID=UPI0034653DD0